MEFANVIIPKYAMILQVAVNANQVIVQLIMNASALVIVLLMVLVTVSVTQHIFFSTMLVYVDLILMNLETNVIATPAFIEIVIIFVLVEKIKN